MRKLALASFLATLALALPARADTVTIDFESSGHPGAVPGADATNLYIAQGVRFPSRPTIERDEFLSTQVLQQAGPAGRAVTRLRRSP